jgi:hypothetical protein
MFDTSPLSITIGDGTLFQVLASSGDTERNWRVPALFEGPAGNASLVIGSAIVPVTGRTVAVGTGVTVSAAISYSTRALAKLSTDPYQTGAGPDGLPLKTEILNDRDFGFVALVLPVAVPVRLAFNLDAPGATVVLMVNRFAAGTIPPGNSTRTVTCGELGFSVHFNDPASTMSLAWEYETPTAFWPLAGTDATARIGRLGDLAAALITRQALGTSQVAGVLRWKAPGLTASWIAADDPLPGGWTPQPTDEYQGAGDLDGDGNAEVLVVSRAPEDGGRAGVLHHDRNTGGLTTTAIAKDTLPGGWALDLLDIWTPVGAIDAPGRARLLVQSQYDGQDQAGSVGLVGYDAAGGLRAISIARGTIPGGWTISNACTYTTISTDGYIGAGDVDNDGLAEIVAWTRNPESDRAFAVLDYDPARGALKTAWIARKTVPPDPARVPAGWVLDATDNVVPAGAMIDPARVGVLIQRASPLLPPALGFVRFDLYSRGVVTWLATSSTGPWTLSATDLLLPAGDLNGDGLAEVLIRDQPLGGPCSLALLASDRRGGITAAGKVTGSVGGWTLSADDQFTALGDIDGDGRTEVLIRDASTGGPNHAALLRWNTAKNAFEVTWDAAGIIPGLLS